MRRPHDSFGLLLSPLFFYHALSMRLAYFTSSGRIWDRMPWEARLQFLYAVFFTFSGVGFLLDLANPRPGRIAHIVFLVFMGGVIGVAYGFCFMRAPKLLTVLVALHVVLALVLTPHLGSLAVDWAQVASTAAGVDVIGCLFAILLGYVFFVRFVRKQGLRYFRVQTEVELAEQIHRSLVPPVARHASQEEFYGCQRPAGKWVAIWLIWCKTATTNGLVIWQMFPATTIARSASKTSLSPSGSTMSDGSWFH